MSLRGTNAGRSVQPPSSTNPRGVNAAGAKRTKQQGTAVITLDELDRIRAQVVRTKEDGYEHQRESMRQNLQETSKARVKNWPNTMEAQRAKREEDRIRRLEAEEVSHLTLQLYSNSSSSTTHYLVIKAMSFETVVKRKLCWFQSINMLSI